MVVWEARCAVAAGAGHIAGTSAFRGLKLALNSTHTVLVGTVCMLKHIGQGQGRRSARAPSVGPVSGCGQAAELMNIIIKSSRIDNAPVSVSPVCVAAMSSAQ